jgi:hypothetical protein
VIVDALVSLALLALFPLPAAALVDGCRGRRAPRDVIDSVAVGYALSWCVLYVISALSLRLFTLLWLGAFVAAVALRRHRRAPTPEAAHDLRRLAPLAVVLALAGAVRALPALYRELPPGWDPYFHLLLADRIATLGTLITDLRPWEAIPLNYPIGSHVLVAWVADLGGVPVHAAFKWALVWFGTLTCAQVYALTAAATGEDEAGVHAAGAYGLLAMLGSLDYYRWGGLPNLAALYLFLALLTRLAERERDSTGPRVRALVTGIIFVAIALVHHHVMVVAALGLAVVIAHAWLSGRARALAREVAAGLGVAAVLGAPYFITYLGRARGLGRTGLGRFQEPLTNLIADVGDVGLAFTFATVMGVLLAAAGPARRALGAVVGPCLAACLITYVVLKHGVAAVALLLGRQPPALFTPSRFLTDAVPLLAVFAGLFFVEMRRRLGATPARTLVLIALLFPLNLPLYGRLFSDEVGPAGRAAYAWIRQYTEPGAGLVDSRAQGTYLAHRTSMAMPLPTSEYTEDARNRKTLRAIAAGERPASDYGRVYAVVRGTEFSQLRGREVWRDPSGVRILKLE